MLKLKKSLGQNFLIDNNTINKIIALEPLVNEKIFEIGPGSGNLTNFINNKKPKSVFLIEKDKRFCKILEEKYGSMKNYKILNSDILKYNLNNHECREVIVFGNLPYNISTQVLAKFIKINSWPPFYKKIIFMFQNEVAITILANLKLDVVECFKISKKCFFPVPKIDSKIIVFKPKEKIKFKISKIENLEKITQAFFSNKRKMINKTFVKLFKNHLELAEKLQINLESRPSELSCETYYRMTEFYEESKKN